VYQVVFIFMWGTCELRSEMTVALGDFCACPATNHT